MTSELPAPRAVILDLDGTLVDTVETRIRAWLQALAEEAIPADRGVVSQLIGSDGRRLAREVATVAGIELDDARTERIDARSGALYTELNPSPSPLPGVGEFLDALEASGIPWAIGTSSRREQVGPPVSALRRPRPPLVVDGSSVVHAKPHPELLLAAADALHTEPAECWCIGDSRWDMLAAAAAGMITIAATVGSAIGADELRAAGAQLVVRTLDELIPLLRS